MKKWKILYKIATKDMYEGREPWSDIYESGDDYVEAQNEEEAIELYRDYMKECSSTQFEEGDDNEIIFLDDDDEIVEVAMHFIAEEVMDD